VARFIGTANLLPVTVERVAGERATVRLAGNRRGDASTVGCRLAAGDPAILMLRPERLEVVTAEPGANLIALPVTCTDLVFQGAVLRCALRDAESNEIIAHVEATRHDPALRTGASLWLAWPPEAARLLYPEGALAAGDRVMRL
jgi:ABC-type Fe3+/spermidine/putrescine transport system ATPase subunit